MLAGKTYAPVLHARNVEIKALLELPDATKDLIFPLIVGRPWPNAKHLGMTWRKIQAALGSRRFALDLDPFKRHSGSTSPAAAEFDRLFDPAEGFRAYFEEVASIDSAIPTLQIHPEVGLADQLVRARELDRGLVLRLQHGVTHDPVTLVRDVMRNFEDLAIFIDLRWSPDLLSRELWASSILEAVAQEESERELVVAGSSFPDSFRSLERDERTAEERLVFDNLVRRHNSVALTYGDWGSTRLPKEPVPMGSIPPRIDLPNRREWICFRRNEQETFQEIAARAVKDRAWPSDLQIWGTYQIAATAEGVPDSIKGQTKAAAARVNIHLHQQAHFGSSGNFSDRDEPFSDDF